MTDDRPKKIKQAAAKARGKAHDAVCGLWWWLLLRGLALLVLAICALIWPQKTVGLMVKILAIYLIIDGLWASIHYALSKEKDHSLLAGAVGLLVGVVLLFWTGVSGRVFMVVIGIWAFLQGLGLYFSTRREADADAQAKTLVKYLSLGLAIAGVVLMVWPSSGVTAIGWLIAAVAFLLGGGMVVVAMKLRSLGKRISVRERQPEAAT